MPVLLFPIAVSSLVMREVRKVELTHDGACVLALQLAEKVEVEYVMEKPDFEDEGGHMNPLIHDFLRIFEKFAVAEEMFPVAKVFSCPIRYQQYFLCIPLLFLLPMVFLAVD